MIGDIKDGIELIGKGLNYKKNKKEEQFEKMLNFVLQVFIAYDSNDKLCENDIDWKKIDDNDNHSNVENIIYKLINLKIHNKPLFSLVMNCKEMLDNKYIKYITNTPNDIIRRFDYNIKSIKPNLDILKQELPKILTPDIFDGEKLIVKDE
ncbi:MAG: hypothetical protein IJT14_01720 [Rickettsiales bacterium]|nr:hypothetical protein [Rickettsiales bacterium]